MKQAQTSGFSLDEIRDLVRQLDDDNRERLQGVRHIGTTKLAQIDAKLEGLREFQRTSKGYLQRVSVAPPDHQTLSETRH